MMILSRRLFVTFIFIFLSLFQFITLAQAGASQGMLQPAQATPPPQVKAANVTLDLLKPFALGDHPTIVAHLTTQFGDPIPKQSIIIFVDGKRKATGLTDSAGIATIILKYKFSAGQYHIKALYEGVYVLSLPAASAETEMVIETAKATIRTIPPMAGIKFSFDGQIYTSDEKGFVSFEVKDSGSYVLKVLPVDAKLLPPNVTMEFSRWNDNIFTATRQVYFPRVRALQAGFVFNYLVNQIFYDLLINPSF